MNLKRDATGAFLVRRLDAGGPSASCGKVQAHPHTSALFSKMLKQAVAVGRRANCTRIAALEQLPQPYADGNTARSHATNFSDAKLQIFVGDECIAIDGVSLKGKSYR